MLKHYEPHFHYSKTRANRYQASASCDFSLQEIQSIHDSMNIPKLEFIAYINFTFYYKYLKYKKKNRN